MASEHNTRVMLCTTTGHQAYCRRSAGPSHGRRRAATAAASHVNPLSKTATVLVLFELWSCSVTPDFFQATNDGLVPGQLLDPSR
jgi:hypothetical protein